MVDTFKNDQIPFDKVKHYEKIVISPGPGLPSEAGQMMQFIEETSAIKPLMGVCLGFQGLVEYFGGEIYNQQNVKHGVSEECWFNTQSKLFNGLPDTFNVGLYHSWAAQRNNFPDRLQITALSQNGIIMACEHESLPICGVQFHPESILTDHGLKIVENFILNF